jgi:hypothetical protein
MIYHRPAQVDNNLRNFSHPCWGIDSNHSYIPRYLGTMTCSWLDTCFMASNAPLIRGIPFIVHSKQQCILKYDAIVATEIALMHPSNLAEQRHVVINGWTLHHVRLPSRPSFKESGKNDVADFRGYTLHLVCFA